MQMLAQAHLMMSATNCRCACLFKGQDAVPAAQAVPRVWVLIAFPVLDRPAQQNAWAFRPEQQITSAVFEFQLLRMLPNCTQRVIAHGV